MRIPLLAALATLLAAGCAANSPTGPTVGLRFRGGPPTARVTIDDVALGPLEEIERRGVRVRAGVHRVSVEADGFFPFDRMVNADAAVVVIPVEMQHLPD